MEIAAWITSGLLAAIFLMAGAKKITTPYEKRSTEMTWVARGNKPLVWFVAVMEMLGAIGLILPRLTGILPWLSVAAAVGLALVQVLAIIEHVRYKEYKLLRTNFILLALAVFTAIALIVVL